MEKTELEYKHLVKRIESPDTQKSEEKLFTDVVIIYAADGRRKELYTQVVTMLFTNQKHIGDENKAIGFIHYAAKDTTKKTWDKLKFGHLLHLAKSAVKECINKTNEIIKDEYPNTNPLTQYNPEKLEREFRDFVFQNNENHIPPSWAMGEGGDA